MCLSDGVEQRRLPEVAVAQVTLIDEHISAGQCVLDPALESKRDGPVWCVIAEEYAQRGLPLPVGWINCPEHRLALAAWD